jgi:acyl-CoA synthetase (AMP-forming)/AMP-acid ligase II
VFPADIEHELRARFSDLGRVGAVFAAIREDDPAADDAGAIVITHEVDGTPSDRLPGLAAELRHFVVREFGVDVASILLLPAGTVARTTSGKVRRSEMRERFREGRLKALYPPAPAA